MVVASRNALFVVLSIPLELCAILERDGAREMVRHGKLVQRSCLSVYDLGLMKAMAIKVHDCAKVERLICIRG